MQSRYLPTLEGWLFSAKTFAAAMLALSIALAAGLDRPYWAMATVYITANPLTGAVRSKGLYRMVGTLIGAIATILLIPNLDDAPALLTGALALWVGACLYLAVLDRTPRGYAFMLAGYTAAIIGFPLVDAPGTVWDACVSRVEEIGLGIACTTLVSTLILPRPVAPVLRARLVEWRSNIRRLALDSVAAEGDPETALDADVGRIRLRLAADAVEIRTLTTHLAYDTTELNAATPLTQALEQRLVMLLPVLAAVRDRVADLRALGGLTPPLRALMARLHGWIEADPDAQLPEAASALREQIEQLEAETESEPARNWACMLRGTLLSRFAELVDLRDDFLTLRQAILAPGGPRRMPHLQVRFPGNPPIYRDHGIALLRGATAAITLIVTSLFWIEIAWPEGAQAATLAAIACCFTASQDDPVPALWVLLATVFIAAIFTAVGQFAILPTATTFEMVLLAMGAFFIPAGMLATIPATQKLAGLPIFAATLLALQNNYSADFAAWANGSAAGVLGCAFAAIVTAIVVPAAAELSLRRRLRAGWADLAAAARGRTHGERLRLAELFLDRLGLIAPLIAASAPGDQQAAIAAMQDLRVGINLVDLNTLRHDPAIQPQFAHAVDNVLHDVAAHFGARAARDRALPPPETMLHAIDRALDECRELRGPLGRGGVRALTGLRRTLFTTAPPYIPPPLQPAAQEIAA